MSFIKYFQDLNDLRKINRDLFEANSQLEAINKDLREENDKLRHSNDIYDFALTKLAASDFDTETPEITLVGRPIAWGNASDQDYGLAVGDSFYFNETNDDGTKNSGWYRIIGMDTSWDNNGVATVTPQLKREELLDEQ